METKLLKRSPSKEKGIGLFAMVRDELYFLPRFFEHYRKLGVTDFVVYDDRSIDGTTDYLVAQPDCSVLTGPYRFDTTFGVMPTGLPKKFFDYAKEFLPDAHFGERWALTVDADEFLFLPSGFENLGQFTSFLDSKQRLFASGPMVDFYPQRLADMLDSQSTDVFSLMPYFDRGPLYRRIPQFPYIQKDLVGIRGRLTHMLLDKRPDLFAGQRPPVPQLFKVPLLKHGNGIGRVGCHYVTSPPYSSDLVALAHFKLYPGIGKKISMAVQEKQHWGDSVEYRWLDAILKYCRDDPLLCDLSRKFDGSVSFEAAGLIGSGAAS